MIQMAASRLIASAVISMRSRSCRISLSSTALRRCCVRYSSTATHRPEHDRQRQLNPHGHERDGIRGADEPIADTLVIEVDGQHGGQGGRAAEDVADRARDRRDHRRHGRDRQRCGAINSLGHFATSLASRHDSDSTTSRSKTSPKWRTSDVSASTMATWRPSARDSDVTPPSEMPQGTMSLK